MYKINIKSAPRWYMHREREQCKRVNNKEACKREMRRMRKKEITD